MKVILDGILLFEITETEKKLFEYYIKADDFREEISRRLRWVFDENIKDISQRMRSEWDKKLEENGATALPIKLDDYVSLVTSQPNYKDRSARQAEEDAEIAEQLRVAGERSVKLAAEDAARLAV
jgi:hypothetical protein